MPKLLGISGSPVKKSNTDRLIELILKNSGEDYELIKLSDYDLNPCQACLGCASDNVCKQDDEWSEVAPKIKEADGFVIGGYAPYNAIDARTKILMERMYSMRHQKVMNQGKPAVAVAVGMKGMGSVENAVNQIATFAEMEQMNLLGTVMADGNVTCLSCGYGEECEVSALPMLFGEDCEITDDKFTSIEEQDEVTDKAKELAQKFRSEL
ncbi:MULTISPECIES: flavodoxin family protein [unclassified Candidatus Frackibacter]|uniref:flavodoxin family protein n=1 Tax=unclassified Candidatus Frackibacter TaxID=2648818 RepID=UPI0008BDBF54|nr:MULTISPECIES: flavodoxin family protein [unclassified Candidatus Frackibacter]SEM29150.1 Multimeric flavodoxin WrbA [Candidatus Frackibacter sp. WG12]SFL34016.1 Multimeric flavodoxin WrbA [Candidatus Frackibacter sp. WG13]